MLWRCISLWIDSYRRGCWNCCCTLQMCPFIQMYFISYNLRKNRRRAHALRKDRHYHSKGGYQSIHLIWDYVCICLPWAAAVVSLQWTCAYLASYWSYFIHSLLNSVKVALDCPNLWYLVAYWGFQCQLLATGDRRLSLIDEEADNRSSNYYLSESHNFETLFFVQLFCH